MVRELAKLGARQRLEEIKSEQAELERLLANGMIPKPAPKPPQTKPGPAKNRVKISAKSRKQISDRMKRYWSKRRADKAADNAGTSRRPKRKQ
ncbi:MAG: hypothetical protein ACM3KM_03075 [Acidobacteriaceae bacterium]